MSNTDWRKEKREHPWLTDEQAKKVASDHRLVALDDHRVIGRKAKKYDKLEAKKQAMLQQRDIAYPIMAYKGTMLPTTDMSIAGISKEMAHKHKPFLETTAACDYKCPSCKYIVLAGHRVAVDKSGNIIVCPSCRAAMEQRKR